MQISVKGIAGIPHRFPDRGRDEATSAVRSIVSAFFTRVFDVLGSMVAFLI